MGSEGFGGGDLVNLVGFVILAGGCQSTKRVLVSKWDEGGMYFCDLTC